MTEFQAPAESLKLEEFQNATRERMTGRIDSLVSDDQLREVLRAVGNASYERPDGVTDEEFEALQLEHKNRIATVTAYEDIYGLQAATKAIFDLRGNSKGYRERWEADGAVYDPGVDYMARELAQKYNLLGNSLPKYDHYDLQLNLGGAANSMLYRQTYGSEIMPAIMRTRGRHYSVDTEINLGSTRPIDATEKKRSLPYAQNAKDEFDLAKNAAEAIQGIIFNDEDIYEGTDPSVISYLRNNLEDREVKSGVTLSEQASRERYLELSQRLGALADGESAEARDLKAQLSEIDLAQPPNKWRVAAGKASDGHNVFAISAGLQSGVWDANNIRKIRPNTADTYAMLQGMLHDMPVGSKALAITSAHFTGFQGADIERLAYDLGFEVETVGFDPTLFNEAPKPTHELMQEIHSLVSSNIGVAKYIGLLEN